ncbi:MAG: hypothetical protein R3F59_08840 [Myxococcota bacterium]
MNVGRNEILIGVAVLVVATMIAAPMLISGRKSDRVGEVEANVEAIRQAELQYHDAFGEYVSAEAAPRPAYQVDPNPIPWKPTDGFRKLAWAPESTEVVGSYSVQADGAGFKVTGSCDVDGDGQRATFEATHEVEAHATSPAGVY